MSSSRNQSTLRWLSLAGYLGLLGILAACTTARAVTATAVSTETPEAALLRLEDGAVQVRGENAAWLPVTGESTFELVGEVESTDPWMVTGNTFAVRESTQIAEGLEVGDLVRVRGIILSDNTWLASSIALAAQENLADPALFLIGKVDSIAPWVVHGITLSVTDATLIAGEITPDMLVVVEILLLDDGTWEVLSIAPLSESTQIPGCATVAATVVSVDGNEIRFGDWPAITLVEGVTVEDESGAAATLSANQTVLVVICSSEEGQFQITKIIILNTEQDDSAGKAEKMLVCHKPDKKGGHTLSIAAPAVSAHLAHGDTPGACP
jgi:hypothetical protein